MFSLYRSTKLNMMNVNMATLGDTVMMIETQNIPHGGILTPDPNRENSSSKEGQNEGSSVGGGYGSGIISRPNPLQQQPS